MLGKPPGVYVGPTHSGRRDVLFRVLYAPDDCELLRPLCNAGAEFNKLDIAGMLYDGSLTPGTLLAYVDGTHWLVYGGEMHELRGGEPTGRRLWCRYHNRERIGLQEVGG